MERDFTTRECDTESIVEFVILLINEENEEKANKGLNIADIGQINDLPYLASGIVLIFSECTLQVNIVKNAYSIHFAITIMRSTTD